MRSDAVGRELARCTVTASKVGNVADHGVDLVHPPFWWYFWGVGLGAWGLALSTQTFIWVMVAVVAGYEIGRAPVRTPVTNAHQVFRLLLEKNKTVIYYIIIDLKNTS